MNKLSLLPLLMTASVIWFSCKTSPAAQENSFGAGVSNPDAAVSLADVSRQLDTVDSLNVIVKAKVSDVCQAKGCWMNLADGTNTTEEQIFVQFYDYGFFMPKDIAGREVIVEGKAYKEQTSVEDLRHYAEDAGKSAEEIAAITEPVTEKKFMATGVVLVSEK